MDTIEDLFLRDGFILIPSAIGPTLLAHLREATEPLVKGRGTATSSDSRHQTLLDPKWYSRAFVEFLNLHSLNRTAERMMGTEELIFAGLALLLGKAEHALCMWHRDFGDTDPEMPAMLEDPQLLIQYNCPLYDDSSLWVVPRSHARPTRDEERDFARRVSDVKTVDFGKVQAVVPRPLHDMPGSMPVRLEAGDCLLYNPLIWHAAEYRPEWKRATLHGGWRRADAMERFKNMRFGLGQNPWLLEPAYLGDPGPYFGPQMERYVDAYRKWVAKPAPAAVAAVH